MELILWQGVIGLVVPPQLTTHTSLWSWSASPASRTIAFYGLKFFLRLIHKAGKVFQASIPLLQQS
jgi:hypothetical protein